MVQSKEEKGLENILDLVTKNLFNFIRDCLKTTTPEKSLSIVYYISIFIILIFTLLISFGNSTISSFSAIFEYISNIYIALFAATLTGFALMQAILKPITIVFLSGLGHQDDKEIKSKKKISSKKTSTYINYTEHILGVIFYFMIIIFLNIFVKFFIIILTSPSTAYFIDSWDCSIKIITATLLISFYLALAIHGILEMFSLIFNLFALYSYDNTLTGKEVINEMKKDESK